MAFHEQLHHWALSAREAVELQRQLRDRVKIVPLERRVETIAGADISFNKDSPIVYAGIVVLRIETMEVIEESGVISETNFPYVPGLLTFREAPAMLEAWAKLKIEPDALMIDGHGIAHPRRFGIASHIGLLVNRPTFGCGKSVLAGKYTEPPSERGNWTPLMHDGEMVGAALRTKKRVQPIFVSPGHLIDLDDAIALTLATDGGYRQPEPTRLAHNLVNALRVGERSI
jgi:deoxyribonuclease V